MHGVQEDPRSPLAVHVAFERVLSLLPAFVFGLNCVRGKDVFDVIPPSILRTLLFSLSDRSNEILTGVADIPAPPTLRVSQQW